MYYVTIVGGSVSGISNAKTCAPDDHIQHEISKEDYLKISARTHYFDVSAMKVLPNSSEMNNSRAALESNAKHQSFLFSTDWMILRHQRELTIGKKTTLSHQELVDLEIRRQSAADAIVKVDTFFTL